MKFTLPDQRTSVSFVILLILFAIALYGYVLRPPSKPANPPDVLFTSSNGPVLFPHAHHIDENGAAIECTDCHHKSSGDEKDTVEMKCRACHYSDPDIAEVVCPDDPVHPRCIGKQCMSCHDGEECVFCHRKAAK